MKPINLGSVVDAPIFQLTAGVDGAEPVVTIRKDGTLEFGPAFVSNDRAAAEFWLAVAQFSPQRTAAEVRSALENSHKTLSELLAPVSPYLTATTAAMRRANALMVLHQLDEVIKRIS